MENLEQMHYAKQTRQPSQAELLGYRTLATAIFKQAIDDMQDTRATVTSYLDAWIWILGCGYFFLTEVLSMDLDQSRYNKFLQELKEGKISTIGLTRINSDIRERVTL